MSALAIIPLLAVAVWASFYFWRTPVQPKPQAVESWRKVGYDYELVVRWSDDTRGTYRGSCTVWHVYPSGNRCGTHMESWLGNRWTQIKWQEAEGRAAE